jgi:hypothetical protein
MSNSLSLSLCLLMTPLLSFCQFYPAVGLESGIVYAKTDYAGNVAVLNENTTVDLYRINAQLNPFGQTMKLQNSGRAFSKVEKWAVGYSLGLSYSIFTGESELQYRTSSTEDIDSIVNDYDGFTFRSNYQIVQFSHNLDVHWNISEKWKFTNSLSLGLSALVKTKTDIGSFDGAIVSANHPVLGINYLPQFTRKHERFWLSYYLNIQLFRFGLFRQSSVEDLVFQKIPFENIGYQTLGIRITPVTKVKQFSYEESY